jgi:5-methylcytosine-specific restriction endonuclease McrA
MCRASFIAERINIDGGMCQECKEHLGYIVDHVEELTPDNIHNPEIALNHNNFRYLCLTCHNRKTFGQEAERHYYFDEEGQIHECTSKSYSV